MRFLLDQNLSPTLVTLLTEAGHDAVHVRDLGLSQAPDERVMSRAAIDNHVLISSDSDLESGAIVVMSDTRMRIRPLPL